MAKFYDFKSMPSNRRKACPILSIQTLADGGAMAECVGNNCMWWDKCGPKQIKINQDGSVIIESEKDGEVDGN